MQKDVKTNADIIIRVANVKDAEALYALNAEFNGSECTTKESLYDLLLTNRQETVFVAEEKGLIIGFCCVQLFKSMCYASHYAEITELYVKEEYRKKGIATKFFSFTEQYYEKENIKGFQLFTGGDNTTAQALYEKLGFKKTDEIMYRKKL